MTTRRALFRSSVFLVLAMVSCRVPACEYGQDATTIVELKTPPGAPEVPQAPAPIVSNLPSLLV
jgi:hypothetical protein